MLRTNLWLVPGIEVLAAIALFAVTLSLDRAAYHGDFRLPSWVISGTADAARQILTAIATAVITVVGVVFSIILVTLTLASTQFGPRMLRNFIRDRGTQLTLGTFVATFVYAVLVLVSIGPGPRGDFVPHIGVTVTLALMATALGVLIYFIHHTATSIQLHERLVQRAFEKIRQASHGMPAVMIRQLEAIVKIMTDTSSAGQRRVLLGQAAMIQRASERSVPEKADRDDIQRRYEEVLTAGDRSAGRNRPADGTSSPVSLSLGMVPGPLGLRVRVLQRAGPGRWSAARRRRTCCAATSADTPRRVLRAAEQRDWVPGGTRGGSPGCPATTGKWARGRWRFGSRCTCTGSALRAAAAERWLPRILTPANSY